MKINLTGILVLWMAAAQAPALAHEHGFPTLNSAGRYLGMGWSHHSYHSHVDGRFDVINRRHPASNYPSRFLVYPYLEQSGRCMGSTQGMHFQRFNPMLPQTLSAPSHSPTQFGQSTSRRYGSEESAQENAKTAFLESSPSDGGLSNNVNKDPSKLNRYLGQ